MLPDHLRAVCFDIGGVLVQVQRGFLAEELARALGADTNVIRQLLRVHGKRRRISPEDLAAVLARACDMPERAGRIETIVRRRHRDIDEPLLYPDAIPTLTRLRAAGWRLCFLSNAISDPRDRQQPAYFSFAEVVVHSWEIGCCKPDVEAFRAIESRMGLACHELVSVGDSWPSDVQGAMNAGWSAVHLPRSNNHDHQPDLIPTINSLLELHALLPRRPHRVDPSGSATR